jgi:hypothetical protein
MLLIRLPEIVVRVSLDTCAEDKCKLAGMRRDMQVDKSNTVFESLFQNLDLALCPSLCRNRVLFRILAQDS